MKSTSSFLSPMQTDATLLDVTCCVRLHKLLDVVACCCAKFETSQTFHPTTPSQCWIRCHALITHGLQRLMGCILPTMHCRSQHCWELLHPFANTHATTLHIVGATMLGAVASRLHAALVSKLKDESLLPNLIDVAVLLKNKNGWHCLRFMSAFNVYNDVSRRTGFKFFFPLGNLSLCDRKHESDQNPERPQPMLFPREDPWGRGLVWPLLMTVYNGTWMF